MVAKRRRARAGVAIALLAACFTAACADENATAPVASGHRSVQAGPPNILLILTDDQDAASMFVMQKVNALVGARGVTFSRAYAPTSWCCPARTSILRGQYAHNHGVLTNGGSTGGFGRARELGLEQSTLATWLTDAGYATGFFGKYLNEYGRADAWYVPPGWTEWVAFRQHWVTWMADNGRTVQPAAPIYNTDLMVQRVNAFARREVAAGRPFFALAAFKAPHGAIEPHPTYAATYDGHPVPRPPSFGVPSGLSLMPAAALTENAITIVDTVYRGRLELLRSVDDAVEAILAEFDSLGILDNTLVIYTSDNGWMNGEHAIVTDKNVPYEESVRIPLLIRGSALGVRRGALRDHLVAQIDLAPTIADFAGATVPAWVDGRSLRPLLTGRVERSEWRRGLLLRHWWWGFDPGGNAVLHEVAAVRTHGALYTEWSTGERAFFQDETDPWQMDNLARPRSHRGFATWLGRLERCAGPACADAELNR